MMFVLPKFSPPKILHYTVYECIVYHVSQHLGVRNFAGNFSLPNISEINTVFIISMMVNLCDDIFDALAI